MVATPPGTSNAIGSSADAAAVQKPDGPVSIGEAIAFAHESLQRAPVVFGHGTDNAWDEAVMLVLSAAGLPASAGDEVLQQRLSRTRWNTAQRWLDDRIKRHIPLPYLTGEAWFADLPFRCDPRALVPRSPLAELIRCDYLPWWNGAPPQRLLDLCCGGGCIGIAAAVYAEELSVTLADIDEDALELAAENLAVHALESRIAVRQSDLFDNLAGERFDIILCNPPYVDAVDLAAMPAEYHAEPSRGLGAGSDGLELARRVLSQAEKHLTEDGLLFLELGNTWKALDELLDTFPITWLEFANGGHGVCVLRRDELLRLAEVFG